MKQVASLQYGVIFKKAFSQPDIFSAFVKAVLGIEFSCDKVETEKSFKPTIDYVDSRFDLFAQDEKNRVIVDIQHAQSESHYDRFLYYHCAALLEQIPKGERSYRPKLKVFTIVVLTSNDRHGKDVLTIDFDPKDLHGNGINEIPHKVIFLCPKYVNENTPKAYKEWLDAIKDTLDEKVEESNYHDAMIQKIFTAIEKDGISPTERYAMFEEYDRREIMATELKKEILKEKKLMAKNLIAANVAMEIIVQTTGLTVAEIENLPNEDLDDE